MNIYPSKATCSACIVLYLAVYSQSLEEQVSVFASLFCNSAVSSRWLPEREYNGRVYLFSAMTKEVEIRSEDSKPHVNDDANAALLKGNRGGICTITAPGAPSLPPLNPGSEEYNLHKPVADIHKDDLKTKDVSSIV